MDAKVFRLAILTIISAFILVLLIVYATNAKRINQLVGGRRDNSAVSEDAQTDTGDDNAQSGASFGDQIGDDLDAFLLEEDFFDEAEVVPSVVVIRRTTPGESGSGAATEQMSTVSSDEADLGISTTSITDNDAGAGEMSADIGETGQSTGSGVVVGQLVNPNPDPVPDPAAQAGAGTDSSGYLTSLPDAPAGGYGQYIPAGETIGGTPVGDMP